MELTCGRIDDEGVRVLVAGSNDSPSQIDRGPWSTVFLRLAEEVVQLAGLRAEDEPAILPSLHGICVLVQ